MSAGLVQLAALWCAGEPAEKCVSYETEKGWLNFLRLRRYRVRSNKLLSFQSGITLNNI